jgi:hypothetical protein
VEGERFVMQAINLNIKGIKCDNPECNFRDDSALYKEYSNWLNKPCPRCGTNLLTETDLRTIKIMVLAANILNWVLKPFLKPCPYARKVRVKCEMNGTGQVLFKPEETR